MTWRLGDSATRQCCCLALWGSLLPSPFPTETGPGFECHLQASCTRGWPAQGDHAGTVRNRCPGSPRLLLPRSMHPATSALPDQAGRPRNLFPLHTFPSAPPPMHLSHANVPTNCPTVHVASVFKSSYSLAFSSRCCFEDLPVLWVDDAGSSSARCPCPAPRIALMHPLQRLWLCCHCPEPPPLTDDLGVPSSLALGSAGHEQRGADSRGGTRAGALGLTPCPATSMRRTGPGSGWLGPRVQPALANLPLPHVAACLLVLGGLGAPGDAAL